MCSPRSEHILVGDGGLTAVRPTLLQLVGDRNR
jgi:hypothetical protein